MSNLELEFEVVDRSVKSIHGGVGWEDKRLELTLYERDGHGKVFLDSVSISREEMLEFLGLDT